MRKHISAGLVAAAAMTGCGSSEASPGPKEARPARQFIVGIDLSASRTPTQLADGQTLLTGIVNDLQPGDRLVLIQTYQQAKDDAVRWERELPRVKDPAHLTAGEKKKLSQARTAAMAVVPSFFDVKKSREIKSTDILQTLFRAADYAKARPRDSTVVLLLSDMLNSTDSLNMERPGGIPGKAWVGERRKQGRLPDLRGVCVFAAGADVDSQRGVAARAFWLEYVRQAGGTIPEGAYRSLVTAHEEVHC